MYVIHSQQMASFLMSKGFKLVKTDISKKDSSRNVFLFKDTLDLRKAMENFNK